MQACESVITIIWQFLEQVNDFRVAFLCERNWVYKLAAIATGKVNVIIEPYHIGWAGKGNAAKINS